MNEEIVYPTSKELFAYGIGRPIVEAYSRESQVPDFFIDTVYPNQIFDVDPIDFSGNYISVLNSYLPQNFENVAFYYSFQPQNPLPIGNDAILRSAKIIPILPRMILNVNYERLYKNFTDSIITITNGGAWGMQYSRQRSTPLIIMLSRDVHPVFSGDYKNRNFRFSCTGAIPAAAATSTIQILKGYHDDVEVNLQFSAATVNPVNILISQENDNGTVTTEFNVFPPIFPYAQNFILPRRDAHTVYVAITGGGAAEAGTAQVDIILSEANA